MGMKLVSRKPVSRKIVAQTARSTCAPFWPLCAVQWGFPVPFGWALPCSPGLFWRPWGVRMPCVTKHRAKGPSIGPFCAAVLPRGVQ